MEAEDASEEYKKIERCDALQFCYFAEFNKFVCRLDTFLGQCMDHKDYRNLWKISQIVCLLYHRQTHIERGFKTNKDFEKTNQSQLSLKSLRLIYDFLQSNGFKSHNVPISHQLLKDVKSARSRRHTYLEDQAKTKVLTERELKRKIVDEEIEQVQSKKAFFEKCIEPMLKPMT